MKISEEERAGLFKNQRLPEDILPEVADSLLGTESKNLCLLLPECNTYMTMLKDVALLFSNLNK